MSRTITASPKAQLGSVEATFPSLRALMARWLSAFTEATVVKTDEGMFVAWCWSPLLWLPSASGPEREDSSR
jgi:hypothetical protein